MPCWRLQGFRNRKVQNFSFHFSLPGTGPGRWVISLTRYKGTTIFRKTKTFTLIFHFFWKKLHFAGKNTAGTRYICMRNPKNIALCQFVVCRAATNGANPAKFIQPKPKRNNRPAPFTHRDTGKSPRKAKRNREFRRSTNFPYLCGVFYHHRIAHNGIWPPRRDTSGRGFCYIKFGVVFLPSARIAISHTISETASSFWIITWAVFPQQSNK